MRGDQHDHEGQHNRDGHALEGAPVEGILAFHEAPVVLGVLKHHLEPFWRCLGEFIQQGLPSVVDGQLFGPGVPWFAVSLRLYLHCDQLSSLLVEAQVLLLDVILAYLALFGELFQVVQEYFSILQR